MASQAASTSGASTSGSSSAPVQKECSIPGKAIYTIWRSDFEIDAKYQVRLAEAAGSASSALRPPRAPARLAAASWQAGERLRGLEAIVVARASAEGALPAWA